MFRSGFVSIIGAPNAGKSTLLNALVGEKLAIVTAKPQTTRTRIQGILNLKAAKGRPAAQIIFIDTPGVHRPDSRLNRRMLHEIHEALESRDLILLIVDASEKSGAANRQALELIKQYVEDRQQAIGNRQQQRNQQQEQKAIGNPRHAGTFGRQQQGNQQQEQQQEAIHGTPGPSAGNTSQSPVFLLLNKIDKIPKQNLLPLIEHWNRLHQFQEIIPIAARTGEGLDRLLDKIAGVLPQGPRYFPEDQLTDQPERFMASEIIREKVLEKTGKEVPYAIAVMIERYEELDKLVRISATIYCEREGQKGILIGKRGERLKEIGTAARLELERLLGKKLFLELHVKVQPDWRDSESFLEDLTWRK